MSHSKHTSASTAGALVVGGVIGAAAGTLLASRSGKDTRKAIGKQATAVQKNLSKSAENGVEQLRESTDQLVKKIAEVRDQAANSLRDGSAGVEYAGEQAVKRAKQKAVRLSKSTKNTAKQVKKSIK